MGPNSARRSWVVTCMMSISHSHLGHHPARLPPTLAFSFLFAQNPTARDTFQLIPVAFSPSFPLARAGFSSNIPTLLGNIQHSADSTGLFLGRLYAQKVLSVPNEATIVEQHVFDVWLALEPGYIMPLPPSYISSIPSSTSASRLDLPYDSDPVTSGIKAIASGNKSSLFTPRATALTLL